MRGLVVNFEPLRVDPILDAAPGTDISFRWSPDSVCTDCGTVDLAVVPSWGLGDALCIPCVVRLEVAAEVDAQLDYRLAGRRYVARLDMRRRQVL